MPRLENANSYKKADKKTLLRKAEEVVTTELNRQSSIFDPSALESLPRFHPDEVLLGRVLGRGGFCVVHECSSIRLQGQKRMNSYGHVGSRSRGSSISSMISSSGNHRRGASSGVLSSTAGQGGDDSGTGTTAAATSSMNSNSSTRFFKRIPSFDRQRDGATNRSFDSSMADVSITTRANMTPDEKREVLARRVWAKKSHKYVVKRVEPSLLEADRVTFLKGTIDLVLETHYLASMNHQHILRLRGLSKTGPFEDVGYFIILDQLSEILSKRLTAWMHAKRATQGITGALTGGRRKVTSLLTERLLVAYDIADAMDYLHSRNIIFRDLKPDNIGFDIEGTLKIFDFGLARSLQDAQPCGDGLYKLTGFTGAIRYMSPEVGLREPYNLLADVYSWSMLMWYIMALEPPMGMYTPKMFIDKVFQMGYRPMVKDSWPRELCRLMKQCWSDVIYERPTFNEIKVVIKSEVIRIDPHTASFLPADSASLGGGTGATQQAGTSVVL